MEISEYMYGELLNLLKHKQKQEDDTFHQPLELELPLYPQEPIAIGDQKIKDDANNDDRGVVVIEF